jgi:hypothetical protein
LAFRHLDNAGNFELRYLQELSFKEIIILLGGKKTLAVQTGRCLAELKVSIIR